MDPSKLPQLAAEIASGPLAAELAPLTAAGADAAAAAVLNRRDRAGYIPARWASVTLAAFPAVDGLVHKVLTHNLLPDDTAAPFAVYCLCRQLDRLDKSIEKGDLRGMVADLSAGLALASGEGLVGDGKLLPNEFGPFLLSAEVKISRAEEALLVPFGADVAAADVEAVRKGNA